MTVTVEQFAADPLAPASAQLALHGSTFTDRRDVPVLRMDTAGHGLATARDGMRRGADQAGSSASDSRAAAASSASP